MPGIFRRAWESVKNGAKEVASKFKWGLEKAGTFAKTALPVVQNVLNYAGKIPGGIGAAANLINTGITGVRKFIDVVPNSSIKDKLNSYADKAENITQKGATVAKDFYEHKVAPITRAVQQSHDKLKELI
jgi:hypothetical protein